MKNIKTFIAFLLALSLCLSGCSFNLNKTPKEDVTIVYTNDVHSYVYNTVTDENGEEQPGLRLSNVAALVSDLRDEGKNVLLVDAGDEFQGSVYGSYDNGASVIELFNACGYQLACPGNHEFDFGMETLLYLTEKADYPFISCNFLKTQDGSTVFEGTKILKVGGVKIAFVGITTPTTVSTTTSGGADFQDENGHDLYTFAGIGDAKELYECVQKAVDRVRKKADYVVVLGHLGTNPADDEKGVSSKAVIANTEGIDALIDGHSHTTIEGEYIQNKNGEDVLLTQTGAYLAAVGVMTLSKDGSVSSALLTEYAGADSTVAAMEEKLNADLTEQMGEKVAELETTLTINNPQNAGQRLIRSQEMNIGDFTADAYYWYFNNSLGQDCDVVLVNGGSVRSTVNAGEVSYFDFVNVCPFGNQGCLIEASGQEILDALEMGARYAGTWNDERNAPAENGGFFQVAGIRYTIDAATESSVELDSANKLIGVSGAYRVKDVQVYNRETGTYEDLVLDQTYRVGGTNYILRNSGDGYVMFADNALVVDFVGQDNDILTQYASSFVSSDGEAVINSANSPLTIWAGYEIDYENPYGAGRITIVQ